MRRLMHAAHSAIRRGAFLRCGRRLRLNFPARIDNARAIALGSDVYVREYSWLNCSSRRSGALLQIGDGSYLGRFVHINANMSVVIEDHVLIADRVFIADYSHGFDDPTVPIMLQPLAASKPVRLKSGCWIGEGAAIMPGITVGRNAVVGANSVVTKDVPDGAVVGGVPARFIRQAGFGKTAETIRELSSI